MNSYTQGVSGGDLCFIEIAGRLDNYHLTIVTSQLGMILCKERIPEAEYILTTREQQFENAVLTYLKRTIKALSALLPSVKADALYVSSDFFPDVIPALFLKLLHKDIKWIQKTFHIIPARRIIPYYAQKLSLCIVKRWADLIIVDNSLLKQQLMQRGFDQSKLQVSPPGISYDYIKSLAEPDKKCYEGIFMGRFHPSKGLLELIDIWKIVCKKSPRARLAIIGSGDTKLKYKMEERIKQEHLEKNILLLGYLDKEQAFSLIKSGRIFLFPSHEEGFGIAIAEAMACGLPVVAWDLPSYHVNFDGGIIMVPEGEHALMARTVLRVLNDREEYTRLRNRAEEISQNFDWEKAADRELSLIDELWQ